MIQELKVDDQSLRKLASYELSNEPLWASDAGRSNMTGSYTGTFNGYLPNLTLNFTDMSPDDMKYNCSLLENPIIDVSYEDKKTGLLITQYFIGTALSSKLTNYQGWYEGFSITLVGVNKL